MRTNVNLSKRPFSNRRLFWIIIGSAALVTAWFAFWINAEKSLITAKADRLTQQVRFKDEELVTLKEKRREAEQISRETVLTQQDSIELAAARRLINNKAFAWNRLIGDIEKYVPNRTRIANLKLSEVFNAGQGMSAMVEIKAIGENADQLTEMMTRLNESGGLFTIGKTGQDQADENNEIPFTITVIYRPQGGDLQ
jgi:hypothetical protein